MLVLEGWKEKVVEAEQKYNVPKENWREALDVLLNFGEDDKLEMLKVCLNKVPDYPYEEAMKKLVSKHNTKSAKYLFDINQKFLPSLIQYIIEQHIGSGLLEKLIDLAVLEGVSNPIPDFKQKECLEWVLLDANVFLAEKVLPFVQTRYHNVEASNQQQKKM